VDREEALQLLARLHTAQNRFYSGGDEGELRSLLAPEVVWHVPGRNAIAGTYRGHDEVITYFTRRRSLAGNTFRMTRRDVLTGDGNTIAALTDGEATFGGQTQRWSTVGQATGGDLVLVENSCLYRHPARQSEVITIDVDPLWVKRSSFCVAFHVGHGQLDLAEGRSVYVFVKKGMPAPVPTLLDGALAGAKARVAG